MCAGRELPIRPGLLVEFYLALTLLIMKFRVILKAGGYLTLRLNGRLIRHLFQVSCVQGFTYISAKGVSGIFGANKGSLNSITIRGLNRCAQCFQMSIKIIHGL